MLKIFYTNKMDAGGDVELLESSIQKNLLTFKNFFETVKNC